MNRKLEQREEQMRIRQENQAKMNKLYSEQIQKMTHNGSTITPELAVKMGIPMKQSPST
jgi:plasmid maintenance system antidote protein VapI